MIELRPLRHALALAEHRNFARAASAIGITQPALTRSIQALEQELGARLFDRRRRDTEPTALGRLVLDHARRLELSARDLTRELQLTKGLETGELDVGVGPWGGLVMAGPVAGRLVKLHPGLRTRLHVVLWHELPARVRARECDIMLAQLTLVRDASDFETRPFAPHTAFPLCRAGHPLTLLASPTAKDVFAYPVVGPFLPPDVASALAARTAGAAAPRGPHMGFAVTCDSSSTLKAILQRSDAVAMMPPFMAGDEIRRGTLVLLPEVDLGLATGFGVAWLRGRTLSGPAQAFVDLLLEHDRELVEQDRELLAACRPRSRRPRRRTGRGVR
jgi:DNA-binding transcriptional LysR family regulator